MASSIIHIAITSKLNEKLKRDSAKILIGTIAPDISKLIGRDKMISHFLDENNNIPNLYKFLSLYKNYLNDDFVLGYYIHLYVDYLWFKYFLPEIYNNNLITKLDGTIVECKGNMAIKYIYNDYTNLNLKLIDKYNLDLKIFYNEIPKLEDIIKEIPMDKIKLIVDNTGEIIENSKIHKDYTFNINNVKQFIDLSYDIILSDLIDLKVINKGVLK